MDIRGVKIDFLGHAGFLISNGKRIAIDPYNISEGIEKVDIILITHTHYDHCSVVDIEKLARKGTIVISTPDAQSKMNRVDGINLQVVEAGDSMNIGNIKIEAVAAYNKKKKFHQQSEGWVGYVIKMENIIIYHAGDTDLIPEMQRLSGYGKHDNEFVALLPVSGKQVMTAEEAAEAAEIINADIAVPMHYGAGVAGTLKDAQDFVSLCKKKGIRAEIISKIYQ